MAKARLFMLAQFGLLAALVLLPRDEAVQAPSWFQPIAIALIALAVVVLFIAVINLRKALTASPIPKADAALIQAGIYKYIRHPMYTAVIMIGGGIMLNNPTLFTIIAWVALIIVLLNKAHYEDKLLLSKHLNAAKYQKDTGTFLPKLSRSK